MGCNYIGHSKNSPSPNRRCSSSTVSYFFQSGIVVNAVPVVVWGQPSSQALRIHTQYQYSTVHNNTLTFEEILDGLVSQLPGRWRLFSSLTVGRASTTLKPHPAFFLWKHVSLFRLSCDGRSNGLPPLALLFPVPPPLAGPFVRVS